MFEFILFLLEFTALLSVVLFFASLIALAFPFRKLPILNNRHNAGLGLLVSIVALVISSTAGDDMRKYAEAERHGEPQDQLQNSVGP